MAKRAATLANLLLSRDEIWTADLQKAKQESLNDIRCEDRIFNYWKIFERLISLEMGIIWTGNYIVFTTV
jgi:hypothetical protein